MSFSGQSNPPWQRNSMNNVIQGMTGGSGPGPLGGLSSTGTGLPFHQGSQMFMNQQQSQQNMQFGHTGLSAGGGINSQLSSNQMYQQGGGVSYPQPRAGLNPVAFQSVQQTTNSQQQSGNMNMHVQSRQNYNSIGTVTKITNECGLVNDEVFFYRNVCKGAIPKLGDRVVFEASFSQNSQFKWNANRIQLVPQSSMNSSGPGNGSHSSASSMNQPPPLMSQNVKGSGYNAVPPPNEYQRGGNHQRRSPVRRSSPHSDRHAKRERRETINRSQRSRDKDEEELERKRRREDRERSRERNRGREREHEVKRERDLSLDRRDRDRERERERGRSPMRRSSHKGPRTRSIPRYKVQIPKTLLTFKSADVQELHQRYTTLYIPSDFFHAEVKWPESFPPCKPFSAERPCSFHIMHKVVESFANEDKAALDPEDADYSFSAKVMLMACPPISEMYQKCFEEDENGSDHNYVHPSRLISFLVGTRGRNEPMAIGGAWSPSMDGENPETDQTVLIRTAIRTCKALTGIDLSNCTQWYRFLELYYYRSDYANKGKPTSPRVETVVIYLPDINSCLPTRTEWQSLTQDYKTAVDSILNRNLNTPTSGTSPPKENPSGPASLADVCDTTPSQQEPTSQNGHEKESTKPEPAHYSNLDPKIMKIQEIRDELIARNLSSKGLKPQVTARLIKALAHEKSQEEKKITDVIKEEEGEEQKRDEEKDSSSDTDINLKESTENENQNCDEEEAAGNKNPKIEIECDDGENDPGIEVDMSDILILDEYDSRKNEEVAKEMDEKEKLQLQRRYTLPDNPHIIVHPSKTAKGGKFDCSVMSLSVLLDYRPEDNKERLFEVSLFAELFNEMLMRDFGFNIFKELYTLKETPAATVVTAPEGEESIKKEETKSEDDDGKSKDSSSVRDNDQQQAVATDRKQSDVSDKSKPDHQHERRAHKRGLDDDTAEEDSHSIVSGDRKKRAITDKKPIIVKPHLLLSFVYFDTSHCGYIFEKDLEDLFSILGLNLSRGQIRKVLAKSISRHALYYRKLTDRDERLDGQDENENEVNLSDEELKRIALGNTLLLPVFKKNHDLNKNEDVSTAITDNTDNDGMTMYEGAVVHVGKLVSQIKRSEKAHAELEKLHNDLRSQHTELQSQNTKSNTKIKELQNEIKGLNRKLSDTDKDLFLLNRKFNDQYNTLSYIYDKVAPIFARSSEKSHKTSNEGARDKDREKNKEKERDKEKPKDSSDNEEDKHKKTTEET